jgi:ketosteroid isomerase-like protein
LDEKRRFAWKATLLSRNAEHAGGLAACPKDRPLQRVASLRHAPDTGDVALDKMLLVTAAHDAFNARDLDRFLDSWAENCEYTPAVEMALEPGRPYRGHDALRLYWERIEDRWEELRTRLDEVESSPSFPAASVQLGARATSPSSRPSSRSLHFDRARSLLVLTISTGTLQ